MLSLTLRRLNKLLVVFCLLFANSVQAGILDLRLKVDQIFDVQWNISGGNLNASYFNYIYSSINYATQTTSAARWTAAQAADAGSNGRYIAFFNSTTNPGTYGMAVYNSDGSVYKIINNTGTFRALADGAIFYNGNGMWGTLITTEAGYSLGSSGSWAVTVNYPTNADLDAYVAPAYSSDQKAPPPPTPVYSSGITQAQNTKRTIKLSDAATHGMEAHIDITGNSNLVTVEQIGDAHYLELGIVGNSNTVDIEQATAGVGQHYLEANIVGSNNNLDIVQKDAPKTAFVGVNGSYNTANVIQKDSGQHYLQLDLIGDGHNASVLQEGAGNHAATVELTNGGGAWTFDLTQSGSTSKEYSLPHGMSDGTTTSGTCYVSAGCSLTVVQND
jgi:hypothetical protein